MKKILSQLLACLMVLSVFAFGVSKAEGKAQTFGSGDILTETDIQRIQAFLDIETNIPGVTNEDVINDFPENGTFPTEYIYYTPLVHYMTNQSDASMFFSHVAFVFDVWCCETIEDPNGVPCPVETIYTIKPDVYGTFDLSEASMYRILSPEAGQTHINGVILNNCVNLTTIDFQGQAYCTKLSAVNCDNLSNITALDCDYQEITVQPRGFSEPVSATVLGEGSIGMTCSYSYNSCELYAKNNGEFRGWYVDGELISTNYMLSVEYGEGIDIVACYTDDYSPVLLGDVDGDGSVTLADAIQVARCAIGVSTLSAELPNAETAADFDGNGRIDMTDAILIARVAIGVA